MRKNIYLPHLNYTVRVRDIKTLKEDRGSAHACIIYDNKHGCTIYLPPKCLPPAVAHEVTHVLYHICRERSMSFLNEEEHMAYIMQYVVGRILGYKWG
jgi:hypothetical protein